LLHHEVAGGLGRASARRVGRDASEVHAATLELDEEQHVVAPQHDGVTVKKSHLTILTACVRGNVVHDVLDAGVPASRLE